MSEGAESFLDELVTWRELGFNLNARGEDYDRYESLPEWARRTLEAHQADARPELYLREELDAASTHDVVWNAAQRELRRDGRIHGYLRMLWGKKILEWTPSARDALEVMIHLNDRYATDGRDPNSYNGIFWVLGRYDRPWPERPVFGRVRSMSSQSTRRKVRMNRYLETFGDVGAEA
jgi:deoxyribodipyrimidine photo-lyase